MKLMNRLRIGGEKNIYVRGLERRLCNYKEIVWIALQTDTNLVKHAIKIWVI